MVYSNQGGYILQKKGEEEVNKFYQISHTLNDVYLSWYRKGFPYYTGNRLIFMSSELDRVVIAPPMTETNMQIMRTSQDEPQFFFHADNNFLLKASTKFEDGKCYLIMKIYNKNG